MSSKIKTSFTVAQPIERVWTQLTDLEAVLNCVPNIRITRQLTPEKYEVEAAVDLSFVESTYIGEIAITSKDQKQQQINIDGQGKDPNRQESAKISVDSQLSPQPEGTHIDIDLRINIIDKPAAFNEQHVDYATGQLLQAFAKNFKQLFDESEEPSARTNKNPVENFSDVDAVNTATDEPPAQLIDNPSAKKDKSLLRRITSFFK